MTHRTNGRTTSAHEEDQTAVSVVEFADHRWWGPHLIHIPNGGKRNPREAARLRAMGTRKGVSDYLLALTQAPYSGLWLELKARGDVGRRGVVTGDQEQWLQRMAASGYLAAACWGFDAAVSLLEWYAEAGPPRLEDELIADVTLGPIVQEHGRRLGLVVKERDLVFYAPWEFASR